MANPEAKFQEEVNRWGAQFPLGIYVRIHDAPTRKEQPKPWDCQWAGPACLHALELKHSWGDEPLRFDALELHQRDALLAIDADPIGAGWLVVLWRGQARPGYCKRHKLPRDTRIERCYAIPIQAAVGYQRIAEGGSWSLEWAAEHGVWVPSVQEGGKTVAWDLSVLGGWDGQRARLACRRVA